MDNPETQATLGKRKRTKMNKTKTQKMSNTDRIQKIPEEEGWTQTLVKKKEEEAHFILVNDYGPSIIT